MDSTYSLTPFQMREEILRLRARVAELELSVFVLNEILDSAEHGSVFTAMEIATTIECEDAKFVPICDYNAAVHRMKQAEAERDALAAQVAEVGAALQSGINLFFEDDKYGSRCVDNLHNHQWDKFYSEANRALASAPKVLAVVEGMFDAQMQIDDIRDLSQSFCDLGYNASGFIPVRVIVTERGE